MKIKRKNGFTVVELVIIIAVIAILAAVLIPTFSSIVKKASESTDIQTVRNLNTAIKIDAVHHNSMHDALAAAKANGFAVEQVRSIGSGGDNFVAWDSVNDRFVIIKKGDGGNDKFIFPSPEGEQTGDVTDKVAYFVFYDEVPEEQTYSIYLDGNNKTGSVSVSVGFDVGENYGIEKVTYTGTVDNRNIILRTNNTGTKLIVTDETNSRISHYGDSGDQTINCGTFSYHEFGGALKATITGGHYVAEGGSIVVVIDASASVGNVIVDLESGSVQGTVKNTNTQNAVTINGKPGAKTISFVANKENNNLKATFATPPTYTNTTDVGGESDDLYITGVGEEKRYSTSESHDHNFVTVSGSNIKVCTICGTYEYTVISVNNDGEKSENNYEATINSDGSSNVVNTSTDHNHAYGNPEWTWKEDNSEATAKFTCTADDCSYTVTVIASNETNTISGPDTVNPTCTTAGSTTYTADITFNGNPYHNSKVIPIAIDQDAHSWGEPEWTWTNDGNGGYTATATFTCTINQEHTHIIENVTATSAEGTGDHDGQTVYTATVNFNNENYNGYKYVTNYASFTTVFPNTDKYLYRVGNANTVKLGSLFGTTGTPNSANVNVTISAIDNSGVSGTIMPNSTNWSNGTIQFTGTGPVAVTIKEGDGEAYTLNLEVVDGYNVTQYSELQNRNSVLLNNITMSSGGKFSLSDNHTLYGNGFTFDVTAAAYQGTGKESSNYVIRLNNANLDNIRIEGKVYTSYGGTTSDNYNYPCVFVDGGNSIIANSYISNCASPVRVRGGANLYFENTTLKGGSFCNLDIRNGSHVTINGLTTINQVANNDVAANNTKIIGLGIVVYYEGIIGNETMTILNDSLTQYNWVAENQASNAVSLASTAFGNMFGINSKFIYTDSDSVKWVSTGILSLSSSVGNENITSPSGYEWQGVQMLGRSGNLCTKLASEPQVADEYTTSGQYNFIPIFNNNKSGDTYTDGILTISFATGESYNWSANKVSATANGKALEVSISVNSPASYNSTTNNVTFTQAGDYIITCSYTVEDNYRLNNGEIEKYSKTYSTDIHVSVSVSAFKPTISFNGYTTTEYEIADKTYLLVTNATTTVNNIGTVTETVNGNAITISYPVIEWTGSLSSTVYWPIFGDIVTIVDDGVTYNSSTKTKPASLTCYWGKYYGESKNSKTKQWGVSTNSIGGTIGSDVYQSLFNFDRGGSATVAVATYNNKAVYSQNLNGADRRNWTFLVKYCYQSGGYTFYYYIGYKEPTSSGGGGSTSCVAPGTLITLADGTQKPVEELTGEEMLLVWNLETGAYDIAPIMFIDSDPETEYEVIKLRFSDGTEVKVISEHGFWDYDLNKYVYLDENASQYIGHTFAKQNGAALEKVTLVDVSIETETTTAWSPVTVGHLCYFVDGMLSMPGGISGLFNIFEVDAETMSINADKMQKDIETYGLLTLDDFGGMITEEMFNAFNGQYLGVAVGKGLITWDYISYLAERYSILCE